MSGPEQPKDPEQLITEISETRQDLAETVDELSHRVDPREQAKRAARAGSEQARQAARAGSEQAKRAGRAGAAAAQEYRKQLAIAGAVLLTAMFLRLIFRRRNAS
jgi:Protein of unknown function (DUF3618)